MEWLSEQWHQLCSSYGSDTVMVDRFWQEIQHAYSGRGRYYHNLEHIRVLLKQAEKQKEQIADYDQLRFSIFYHDIIYSSLRKNNEIRSAELARERLLQLGAQPDQVQGCVEQIKATAGHQLSASSSDPDLPYFLDFDLSILGADWDQYLRYTQQIRKEYRIYPGWMYRRGRRKVLVHFLDRACLFFTPLYYDRLERKARENLQKELELIEN